LDFRLDFGSTGVFTFWSAITGFFLLNVAAFGLDQDMTQQVLTCKNKVQAARAMLLTVVLSLPIMLLFLVIGLLLFIFYQRPDLMGVTHDVQAAQHFAGEKITVFMHYILTELPEGVRGLVTVGVIAAAMSTLNSAYNSMSSVFVHDIYKPWQQHKNHRDEHYVFVGRIGMAVVAVLLSAMAILCFYWQRYADTPLLQFALGVMVFAYSGMLGVYATAIFTKRGNTRSVTAALLTGFLLTLFFQPYTLDALHLRDVIPVLGFTWQLCVGSVCSFFVAALGKGSTEQRLSSEFAVQEAA
jgi:Na+/proline symporter